MKPCGHWCISRRSEGSLPMAEDRPATSGPGRKRSGASYAHEWNQFVAWSQAAGKRSLPSTPDDVAAYLEYRAEAGARAPHHQGRRRRHSPQPQGSGIRCTSPAWRRQNRAGRTDAGPLSRSHQGAAPRSGLLSGHQENRLRAAQRKGRACGTGVQCPQAGRAGRGDDRPDAGRRATSRHEAQPDSDTDRRGGTAGWVEPIYLARQSWTDP